MKIELYPTKKNILWRGSQDWISRRCNNHHSRPSMSSSRSMWPFLIFEYSPCKMTRSLKLSLHFHNITTSFLYSYDFTLVILWLFSKYTMSFVPASVPNTVFLLCVSVLPSLTSSFSLISFIRLRSFSHFPFVLSHFVSYCPSLCP